MTPMPTNQTSKTPRRLYLDNAATSFPKPPSVHEQMAHYATRLGASPGRGSYKETLEGGRIIANCRRDIASLFGSSHPEQIIFTLNASDALNLAINGIAHHQRAARAIAGSDAPVHIIATSMDHNSVLRPLNALTADPVGAKIEWTCINADPITGLINPAQIRDAIRPETALVITTHGSNVSGTLQPIAEIGAICKQAGVPMLVDAAQTAGRIPIDTESANIDLLAFPGHKHLMGPLGTGGLLIRKGLEAQIDPARVGGTGTRSELDIHPGTMPERYEPGSHNTLGIAGLAAGLNWINEKGIDALWAHERTLMQRLLDGLKNATRFQGLSLIGPETITNRIGVFSFTHESLHPADLAAILETEFGILSRAGIHCAPRAHTTLGTIDNGGSTRISLGPFNTTEDIDALLAALSAICADSSAPA